MMKSLPMPRRAKVEAHAAELIAEFPDRRRSYCKCWNRWISARRQRSARERKSSGRNQCPSKRIDGRTGEAENSAFIDPYILLSDG